ncbi:hypothetical protein GTL21_004753 [Salmonella enterica]|uniref:Uncharacterized protein n=1 Tax=Salmonella enterica subsp. salamae serovar 48:d:z6 TaxID=1151170 RepID=A0A729JU87_SALER|nr:hypothetical protein [Salmonella enterica]MFX13525.1 hypothetical protein [Salmonella enterica]HAE3251881.1 hypothetical protein [Salmonella enterica subsp. salamae serovar 48:d:z6]HAE7840059.1 hypothetical protein [Salmonella enterica subsp. salamae serovar 48:d:z6]
MNNHLVINLVNAGSLKNGTRDTVRYTEDEWPLQNLSYGLKAKVDSVIQPFGNQLYEFSSGKNLCFQSRTLTRFISYDSPD